MTIAVASLRASTQLASTRLGLIEYQQAGSGSTVLISHGTPGGFDQGLVIAEILRLRGFSVLAISRPGYLKTPLATGTTPIEQADAFAALLDTQNICKAAIIGVSGGGPAALHFALRHREKCLSLVMISAISLPLSSFPLSRCRRLVDATVPFDLRLAMLRLIALTSAWKARARAEREAWRRYRDLLQTTVPDRLRRLGRQNDHREFQHLPSIPFDQITTPALVIHGTGDETVPIAHGRAAAALPNSRFHELSGGHEAMVFQSSEVAPVVNQFLTEHSRTDQ